MNGQKRLRLEQLEQRVVFSATNWADTFGSARGDYANDVEVGPNGESYVVGSFKDGTTIDFDDDSDGGVLSNTNKQTSFFQPSDGFLVNYDEDGDFQWAIHAANKDSASIYDVSLDSAGNAYVVGSFESDLTLYRNDTFQATVGETVNAALIEIFVAKISSAGNVDWVQALGGKGRQFVDLFEVTEDPLSGQVELIIGGRTWGTADLDPGPGSTLQNAANDHEYGFLGKYVFNEAADSLALVWLQTRDVGEVSAGLDWLYETDVSGNQVIAVGQNNATTAYLGIFDNDTGQLLEANVTSGGTAIHSGVDRVGDNLFLCGTFSGSVDLDGDGDVDLVGDATRRGFIANYQYDPSLPAGERLRVLWANALTGASDTPLLDVKVSPDGLVYAVGRFSESVNANGTVLQSAGGVDGIVVVADPLSGSFLRANRFGGSGYDESRILQVDDNGAVYLAGVTTSTDATFPNVSGTFASAGSDDGFIAVFKLASSDPPVADAGVDQVGTEDLSITFDASASSDPDGDPLTYVWDFGDGETSQTTNPIVSHTYSYGGQFNVVLTVLDGNGNSASDQTIVTVDEVNDVPFADAGGPYSGFTNASITFDASASSDFDNTDGTADNDQILEYTWDFGDGTPLVTTTSTTVDHSYSAPAQYTVVLTVFDGVMTSLSSFSTAVIADAPAGDPNSIYVWDLRDSFESRQRGRATDYRLVIDVRRDSDGDGVAEVSDAGVAGVAVTVRLTSSSNQVLTLTGTTDSQGIFRSEWIKGLSAGSYRAEVVDLALAGFTWDPFDVLDATANDEDFDFDGAPDELLIV